LFNDNVVIAIDHVENVLNLNLHLISNPLIQPGKNGGAGDPDAASEGESCRACPETRVSAPPGRAVGESASRAIGASGDIADT
jgi:hypothetical protein